MKKTAIIAPAKKINDGKKLKLIANQIRQDLIEALVSAGSGHSAGPLGMADVLKHDPKNLEWQERDRLVLSNGHICPVL